MIQADVKHPTYDEIINARNRCALIVATCGEEYIPIFERLEREVEKIKSKQTLYQKALKIGTRNGTHGGTHCRSIFSSVSQ